jgi:hypothetical protein
MNDPLRTPDGRFRSPTLTERLGLAAPPPEPQPAPPPPHGPQIPAGPMSATPPGDDDLIRAALRRRHR